MASLPPPSIPPINIVTSTLLENPEYPAYLFYRRLLLKKQARISSLLPVIQAKEQNLTLHTHHFNHLLTAVRNANASFRAHPPPPAEVEAVQAAHFVLLRRLEEAGRVLVEIRGFLGGVRGRYERGVGECERREGVARAWLGRLEGQGEGEGETVKGGETVDGEEKGGLYPGDEKVEGA